MNLVLIIVDTLRRDHVGVYGKRLDSHAVAGRAGGGVDSLHERVSGGVAHD